MLKFNEKARKKMQKNVRGNSSVVSIKKRYPLVSIITACYNSEKYIERLLQSILIQNYPSIEVIAVNDGSTDKTLEILNSYKKRFPDNGYKLEIITQKNKGPSSAFNTGIKKFSGDYLTFIADDDFLKPDSIKNRVDYLKKHDDCDMVYGAVEVVSENDVNKVIFTRRIKPFPKNGNLFSNMMLGKNYYYGGLAHLIRTDYFLSIHPKRDIANYKLGQNIQIFLPLYYKGKVGYITKPVATILERKDSHSRKERTEKELRERREEFFDVIVDTLRKINMPEQERENYIFAVQKWRGAFFVIKKLRKENSELIKKNAQQKSELDSHLGIKRSARLLAGNIKRMLLKL